MLEETHYYPYGLIMNSISSSAARMLSNNDKFNGYTLNSNEFSDKNGLEWIDYKNRYFDFQIGRFISVDRLASDYPHYTCYQFAGNRVPNAIDLDGLEEALTTDRLIQAAIQYGITGNKRIGELFERVGIAAISDRNIGASRNGKNFNSPVRAARNGPVGPMAVRPDMLNVVGEIDLKEKTIGFDFNQFIEMKATKNGLTRGYRKGQLEGMIDVLSNFEADDKIKSAELLLVITTDTDIRLDLLEYARRRKVKMSVIYAGIDAENNIYFSDPFTLVNPTGFSLDEYLKRSKATLLGYWYGKDGYPISSFMSGLKKRVEDIVENPATGANDPDPPKVNDQ